MKRALVFAASLVYMAAAAHAGFFPRFEKEIPKEFCGKYELLAEVLPDGTQKSFENNPQFFVTIESKRVVLVSGEIMVVEAVVKVTKEGKTAHLVAFKGSSLSWILTAGKTPSQLGVVQGDKKDRSRSKIFVLTRTDALPAEGKQPQSP